MKIISHRGNICGPVSNKENRPSYIDCAIGNGYDVEIDIRSINGELWLGHDEPQYKIDHNWINKRRHYLWIHCKNLEAAKECFQSIPSPKAEPFKLWLAKVASERLDEMQDPELTIDRALENYLNLGYSENWINQRLKSIEVRKELTDEWKKKGLKEGQQFATLTDIITKAWAGKTTKEYKVLKGLKKENLRDNMTNTELILNMLAEASTKDISVAVNPKDFEASKKVAKQGGNVAKVAMKESL
jgi:hypothetical protein